MCCSRGHYPEEVGLHLYDRSTNHHHIILPERFSTGICVYPHKTEVHVSWRDFDRVRWNGGSVTISVPKAARELGDLVATGIAEGGALSKAWLEEMAQRWAEEHQFKVRVQGRDDGFVITPPPALEYHEWLVRQAARELRGGD